MTVIGPDFVALQVADLARSTAFYTDTLGLKPASHSPPGAQVFLTSPIPFAVREPLPGIQVAAIQPFAGAGVALWLAAEQPDELHDSLRKHGIEILNPPTDGPFGRMFTFADPDGYRITIHASQQQK